MKTLPPKPLKKLIKPLNCRDALIGQRNYNGEQKDVPVNYYITRANKTSLLYYSSL